MQANLKYLSTGKDRTHMDAQNPNAETLNQKPQLGTQLKTTESLNLDILYAAALKGSRWVISKLKGAFIGVTSKRQFAGPVLASSATREAVRR